ncbi:hypothetical protein ES703_36356 [subsurface metagenome]
MNTRIKINGYREHTKASERYVDVVFKYPEEEVWEGSIPIEYRRTGTNIKTKEELNQHLEKAYECCNPDKWENWKLEQKAFWKTMPRSTDTKLLFDILLSFKWTCIGCKYSENPNWARRNQDLKEFGYTIATRPMENCSHCGRKSTKLLLVPLPRGGISGYEVWNPKTRNHIIQVLNGYDVYEAKQTNSKGLLPDHKFPEIRWDKQTPRDDLESLTESQIRRDFQLLSNQRNQQKREVCRKCSQTGKRGFPFGIKFFYEGSDTWPENLPTKGKEAEAGCKGCGWYDMEKWRQELSAATA